MRSSIAGATRLLASLVCLVLLLAGCQSEAERQRQLDVQEIMRMGEKFREKITLEMMNDKQGVDLNWLRNIAWCSRVFAKEMSFIKGVEWKQYVPSDPEYTPGDGRPAFVKKNVVYERLMASTLTPQVEVGDATAEEYMGLVGQVLTDKDIAKLEAIRKRTGCWEAFKGRLRYAERHQLLISRSNRTIAATIWREVCP